MNQPRARIKPGRASLFGGIAVSLASFVLWAAIAHELAADTPVVLGLGIVVAIGVGGWIRIADL